jgi:hypothetical protein
MLPNVDQSTFIFNNLKFNHEQIIDNYNYISHSKFTMDQFDSLFSKMFVFLTIYKSHFKLPFSPFRFGTIRFLLHN